jgi:hypothetical protein
MPFTYRLYGLLLEASDPLPGLSPSDAGTGGGVKVRLGRLPPGFDALAERPAAIRYASPRDDEGAGLTVQEVDGGAYYRFLYGDGTEFAVDRRGETVWASWPPPYTLDDAATYLLGPVLGFVLRLRGVTCLHASAVAVGDRAIAFVGPNGAGKSTLAATLALRGERVLTDDVLALSIRSGQILVHPGYPRVRLWPASVLGLYGAEDALPRLTPTWEKCYLDLIPPRRFQDRPLPLAAVYLLDERGNGPGLPRIEPVPAAVGLLDLAADTYVNYLLDRAMLAQEFEVLAKLASLVPVRRVVARDELAAVAALCDAVLDDALAAAADHGPL